MDVDGSTMLPPPGCGRVRCSPVRALLQRVREASVTVEGRAVGAIGPGLLVLLGVGRGDGDAEALAIADRIAGLRIFQDPAGKMNLSLLDTHRAALVVSQFTLYADTRKGRRPSFIEAAPPEEARRLYARACDELRALGVRVEEGVFAAEMQVALVNDGPVTILLEQAPTAPTR
jgi:D-tyrosyl-tRNA(Tyr) deacylase